MTGKVINLLKSGTIVIPKQLLINYKKLKITEKELIVLIYLIDNAEFDPEKISKDLDMNITDVLTIINNLSKKDILKLKTITNNNIREEYVDLEELYNKLALTLIEEKEEVETTIYDQIEEEFGRTLSAMEYEIIGAWLEQGYTEELISLALKEATYNNVRNLRYIDAIISQWNKKGIKTKEDVEQDRKNFNKKTKQPEEVYEYDWLNEDD